MERRPAFCRGHLLWGQIRIKAAPASRAPRPAPRARGTLTPRRRHLRAPDPRPALPARCGARLWPRP